MSLLTRLKARLGITDNEQDIILEDIIERAKYEWVELRYPSSSYPVDNDGDPIIERRWHSWLIEAAIELYNRQGSEGQVTHNELGINRTYETGTLSDSLASRVLPVVGVYRR